MNHPSLPKNASLWKLHKTLDTATRWLDHCDNWDDHEAITQFITDLETKIDQVTQTLDHLDRCFALEVE
jgi:hypothetical protein